ncbi:DUF1654 domain-containing protein [Pseudomonas tremae]|uniref:DUF1654 domain-containing protein n=1 Tax=Pseudomonas syringae group TaxID=136849 RepID=UPI0001AF4D88|nr:MULTISPECIES: DUF1654 domain-containing protein [Pseudomonas syringae group]KPW30149.1 Uncharacterized protein ALO66_04338 [Pseudomonas coronafaciens pv. atropurpurea]MCF5712262.1 DUF1654 domain-containing protein [Pseudomonas tremae]MCF5746438.1 DUF1654 domain-containing protein [Pseudomonas tremae]MCQ2990970.1 DUF1654 domain-containing protein [Pseudomonas tremae]MCQ3018027.1 DUF1654 domain-containing protein [Pseudomonas tremae]
MLKQTLDTSQHDAYLALAQRIQDAIASDKAQIEHQVLLVREPGEAHEHWERILEQIGEAEGVSVTRNPDTGTAHVCWYIDSL